MKKEIKLPIGAREYFNKEYGETHIKTVVEMRDYISLYGLMEEYAENIFKDLFTKKQVFEMLCLRLASKEAWDNGTAIKYLTNYDVINQIKSEWQQQEQ